MEDITARDMKVKARPAKICITVLTVELTNGLHVESEFDASADHYKYRMYMKTILEVRILASPIVLIRLRAWAKKVMHTSNVMLIMITL